MGICVSDCQVEWGNVPAWLGTILSTGSVLLAFYIILRDRRKAEREQIAQVIVIMRRRFSKAERRYRDITIINGSDQPIYDIGCGEPFRRRWRIIQYPSAESAGAKAEVEVLPLRPLAEAGCGGTWLRRRFSDRVCRQSLRA